VFRYGKGNVSKQELECLEMFHLFNAGVNDTLLLKSQVKRWEYVLYGGRPEFYPQDRKCLLTLLELKREKEEHDRKREEEQARMKERMAASRKHGS
jgi:hypothetical protein